MAGTLAKAQRKAAVLERLSMALGVKQADLFAGAKGDTELAAIMTLERVADAVEEHQFAGTTFRAKAARAKEELEPPVTVETVKEEPLKTTETVKIVPAEEVPRRMGRTRAK